VVLDEALGLGDHAPPPVDTAAITALLAPWLAAGGAALVAARVDPRAWPWRLADLVGGALVPPATLPHRLGAIDRRAVAEDEPERPWLH
jgi:hypothetical protein